MKIELIPLEGGPSATLTAYIQESLLEAPSPDLRPAMIICPGGAYIGITEKEAEPVALKFIAAGYHVFILRYSIGAGSAQFPMPFIDVAKSVKMVRENADRWCLNPDKICLCGFSAGGHVAAILAATWQENYLAKALQTDNQLFKPNALILGYPLLDLYQFKLKNMERFPERQLLLEMILSAVFGTKNPDKQRLDEWDCKRRVTSQMPPTFLWASAEDDVIDAVEIIDFVKTLAIKHIAYEFHIFEKGAHGLSLGDKTVGFSEETQRKNVNAYKWVDLALDWLSSIR